jgi:hypothetical protein
MYQIMLVEPVIYGGILCGVAGVHQDLKRGNRENEK